MWRRFLIVIIIIINGIVSEWRLYIINGADVLAEGGGGVAVVIIMSLVLQMGLG